MTEQGTPKSLHLILDWSDGTYHDSLLLPGAVVQTAYEVVGAVRVRLGSLSTLCTLKATLDSHEEAAQSPIV